MQDFLKDAKWFVFSVLVVAGFWFGPQISDYFEDVERERLQEERRLAALEKNKPVAVDDEFFKDFQAIGENERLFKEENKIALLCELESYHPIRLIIIRVKDYNNPEEGFPTIIEAVEYLQPSPDSVTKTYLYKRLLINKSKTLGYDEYIDVGLKKITLGNVAHFNALPSGELSAREYNSTFYLNRENLNLTISTMYKDDLDFKCSQKTPKEFETYMINHNASVIGGNVL